MDGREWADVSHVSNISDVKQLSLKGAVGKRDSFLGNSGPRKMRGVNPVSSRISN